MQLDNSITFPKFSGASYDDNILADNNDEMERSDAIWYWCIIYYALMFICCCHWWWYIIFDHYCCYAPFITIVYRWYFKKYCLVSNCNTGSTHFCRTHHDHNAEWFIRLSCFHYTTLNVQWYYLQAMCWGIFLYYIYHHTLLSHVCIIPMYYSESTQGFYGDDTTHYIKIMDRVNKCWSAIPPQSCGKAENHQSGVGWHPGLPPELQALTLLWTNLAKLGWNDPQLVLTLDWSFQFLFDPRLGLPIQGGKC